MNEADDGVRSSPGIVENRVGNSHAGKNAGTARLEACATKLRTSRFHLVAQARAPKVAVHMCMGGICKLSEARLNSANAPPPLTCGRADYT